MVSRRLPLLLSALLAMAPLAVASAAPARSVAPASHPAALRFIGIQGDLYPGLISAVAKIDGTPIPAGVPPHLGGITKPPKTATGKAKIDGTPIPAGTPRLGGIGHPPGIPAK